MKELDRIVPRRPSPDVKGDPSKIAGKRDKRRIGRGAFLRLGALGAAALLLGEGQPKKGKLLSVPTFPEYPFALGVASGDPLPDGFVLWMRLAPYPLLGGGMPRRDVEVRWELASDEDFNNVVRSGTALATPEFAHSVHVEVEGLEPGRYYWYRFESGGEISPTGRTKTAPGSEARTEAMTFAFASCQYWEADLYPAYRAMAKEDLDLVVHLGDYIYEWGSLSGGPRLHNDPAPTTTLEGFRNRHALYKTDPDLQAAHAAHPWVVIPDDHEGDNNYLDLLDEEGRKTFDAAAARETAYQTFYEHMPMRRSSLPTGARASFYRRYSYGDLVRFSVLDTRQYRTPVPCGYGLEARCAAALDESATMTGPDQERWLLEGLDSSNARWNVIAQQTRMAEYVYETRKEGGERFDNDTWDGYVGARNRILSYLHRRRPPNPVVIGGDLHSAWVNDLKADFADENSETVGTEFVGTSISSVLSKKWVKKYEMARSENPHVKHFDARPGGYVRRSLTRDLWRSDMRLAGSILDRRSPVSTVASFVVEDGRPGAVRV